MPDRILIPLPGVGTLALSRHDYDAALEAGRAADFAAKGLNPAISALPLLVDASELARLTNTSASWWEAAARDLDCPSIFVGKVRRFKVDECLSWLEAVQERDGNGRVRKCAAAPRART